MKKLTATVMILFTHTLISSCGSSAYYENAAGVFSLPYSASVRIAEGGEVFEAGLVRGEDGRLELSFLEPSLLCGISYGFDEDGSYLSYNGITVKLGDENVKDKVSHGVYVWRGLLEPDGKQLTGRKIKDGEKTYIVLTDGQTEYRLDKESGAPVLITSGDTVISFTEFTKNADLPEGTG